MSNDAQQHTQWAKFFHPSNRIEANFVEDQPNYPAHDHEFFEIVVVIDGTCLHRTVHGHARLVPGDVLLFRPGAWHAYERTSALCLYNCCFDAALLGRELGWMIHHPTLSTLLWSIPLANDPHGTHSLHLPASELNCCRKLLDALCALAEADFLSHFGDCFGLLVQFLGVLARHVPVRAARKPPKGHSAVAFAVRLIDDEPGEPWTLESLARRVHVEPTYFVRLFHSVAGLPPMAYLAQRRLELATGLLRRTDLPVGDIGATVGWLEANQFTRRFRQKFGLSPSKYRARFADASGREHSHGNRKPKIIS